MKSQVNALLHVTSGILKDAEMAYPALKEGLSKDWRRLTLYCQTRGLSVYTLDLPQLESCLLLALETGRLTLEGPFSKTVSTEVRVPRLFSGLWLRVFDKDACLKREVDVNALFFLRCLLTLGKKIEQVCSDDRIQAKVEDYHDIERKLRKPTLGWNFDSLYPISEGSHCRETRLPTGCHHDYGGNYGDSGDLLHSVSERKQFEVENHDPGDGARRFAQTLQQVHLVQAVEFVYPGFAKSDDLFSQDYRPEDGRARADDVRLLNKIQEVADLVLGSFDHFDPTTLSGEWEEEGRGTGFKHGPGAVAEKLKNWEKSQFPNWPHKLEHVFPFSTCGSFAGMGVDRPPNHEVAARLICVPKTAKGPRLIAAEPTAHQYCQQMLLRFLTDQCRKFFGTSFIDFKDQGKSGGLVLQASLDRSLATVDLSDASDRLSCWTVERVVRNNPSLLAALHAARTRYIRDEISDVPSFLSLRKFASQGTATTFPVMSLVMLIIALGSVIPIREQVTWANLRRYRTRVRVFGDDIIVPSHGYARLVRAMDLLQLKINVAKSYVKGQFRESCGTDGYLGYEITPIRPKTLVADSPASCQAVVDTSNNLFNKGLWYASRTAEDLLPPSIRKYLRVVGANEAGLTGLSSFSGSDERHLVSRWNPRLHRNEVRVWGVFVQTQKRLRTDVTGILDFFTRSHSTSNPRVVSEYLDVRKTKARLQWEPSFSNARTHGIPGQSR